VIARALLRRLAVILALGLLGLFLLLAGVVTLVLSTETGTDWALSQLLNQVNGIPGQQVTTASTDGTLASGLDLSRLEYRSDTVRVTVEQVHLEWSPLALMSARLSIPEIHLTDARVEILTPAAPADQSSQSAGPLVSVPLLPVTINLDQITVSRLQIQQGQQPFMIDELSLGVLLQGQALEIAVIDISGEGLDIEGELTLLLNGNLPLDAELQWQFLADVYPESGPASGVLTLAGDLTRLDLRHQLQRPLVLTSLGTVATGVGGGELAINLTHSSESMDLAQSPVEDLVLTDFNLTTVGNPEALQIALTTRGESALAPAAALALDATWESGGLVLEELLLTTATGQLGAAGELQLGDTMTGSLQYRLTDASPLDYIDNDLPLQIVDLSSSGTAQFSLAGETLQGTLQVSELSGDFGDYPFRGQGQIRYLDGALYIDDVQLSTADNSLQADGVLADELDLRWEIAAPQLNQFIDNLGGELQARGQLSGNFDDVQLVSDVRATAVSFDGLFVDNLQMNLQRQGEVIQGNLELTAAGYRSDDRTDNIQSLRLLLEGTESRHQWSLASTTDYGSIELDLQGGFTDLANFSWEGVLRQGRLVTDVGEWRSESGSSIAASPASISLTDNCWRQNTATLCLQLTGASASEGFSLQLDGQLSDYPLSVFNHPDLQPDGAVSLPALVPRLPETVGLAGTANLDLGFTIDAETGTSATVSLQPDDLLLTIRAIDPEVITESGEAAVTERVYTLDGARLTAILENGSWDLQAGTQIGATNETGSSQDFRGSLTSRVLVSPAGELSGGLEADFGDIGWLDAFSQDLDNLEGTLGGRVDLAGTVSEPLFEVDFSLSNGRVSVLPLGINVEQISSQLTSLDDGSIQLTTSALSGEGTLEVEGRLTEPFTTQRSLQARLNGSDFILAEIPDLNLIVTPDVTLTADAQQIELSGSLHLPTLVINLTELPESAVDISRDAVVITYPPDQPQLARSIAAEQSTLFNLPVVADLDISLGDQVSFNGFGLTTEVAGNLNVQQQENGTNLTYGELEIVSGQYSLYGRSLQIRQGKLLFFGAYDNPALDIRATREVESATVGVLMNGTLKNINSQLFSSPALPDSDIIAIMVTGKPFSEMGQQDSNAVVGAIANLGLSRSQGLTNQVREQLGLDTLAITNTGNINNSILTIGKYLTPDLFIRYGIGLFDHQAKLSLDYTLTERITLQAETGEYQSVDVFYRVER
jgi:translocation and assembly module TamB